MNKDSFMCKQLTGKDVRTIQNCCKSSIQGSTVMIELDKEDQGYEEGLGD